MSENKLPKVEFYDNIPVYVKFKYDKPRTGEGQYGKWWAFGVEMSKNAKNWEPATMFPTSFLYKTLLLAGVNKTEIYKITVKQSETDKNKRFWEVAFSDGRVHTSYDLQNNDVQIPGEQSEQKGNSMTQETVRDVCGLWLKIWDTIEPELTREGRDLQPNECVPIATSIFIYCNQNGIKYIPDAHNTPDENTPEAMGMDAPVDDLPF